MMSEADPETLLKPLFLKAQATDEFEFCCSLLRIRGIQSAGWDPLFESIDLMQQVMFLLQAPIDPLLRLRLSLFLYSHATEIDDFYNVIGNLLRVCQHERCSMWPFAGSLHPSGKDATYPYTKIARIAEWASEVGFPEIGKQLEFMLVKQVRNAFFHSDYTIFNDEFRIKNGEPVLINGVLTHIVPIEWLKPRIELGINFVLATIELIRDFRKSYTQGKIVQAKILPNEGTDYLMLTVDQNFGLRGFRSLTDEEKKQLTT